MPSSSLPPHSPARGWRTLAVERRLAEVTAERDALRARVAELERALARIAELEGRSFIAQLEATADDAVFDDAPEPTKVVSRPEGPRYRVTRR